MRLSRAEIAAIKESAREVFGDDVVVRLFGSRVDDARVGGDIDLMVETHSGGLPKELEFNLALIKRIGERKIDILVRDLSQPLAPIEKIAIRDGVIL